MGITKSNINFSINELGHLFPFYLIIDENHNILSFGKSLGALFPEMIIGEMFFNKWKIVRPLTEISTDFSLNLLTNKLVVIAHQQNTSLKLKGQFERLQFENVYLFLGSPWFNSTDQLLENNLTIGDFSFHDSTIDLIHVLKNNEIANNELKEVLDKVNHQKKILEKNQSLLLKKENMLQAIAKATDELLANSNIQSALRNSITQIGHSIDLDVVFISEQVLLEREKSSQITIEWSTLIDNIEISFPDFNAIVRDSNELIAEDVLNKYPFEISISTLDKHYKLYDFLSKHCVQSILIIPIYVRNLFWGVISFCDCKEERIWSTNEFSLLKSFSNSIASAIERNEASKEMYNMALFPLENPDPVVRIDINGNLIIRNNASEQLKKIVVKDVEISDLELFVKVAEQVNSENRQIIFEGLKGTKSYQITARLSENNENINIYWNDISERKLKEKQLTIQEEKYRNIIANMNLGLLEVDLEEHIEFCNNSFTEISGYTLEELKGKKSTELFSNQNVINEKIKLREQGISDSYEIVILNKHEEERWWLVSGAPNYNDRGEIVGSIGIHLDITNQKKLEKELAKALVSAQSASEAKESFLANMSHEIRTPLNAIIGMIRELNKEELTIKQEYYVISTQKASKHLLSIINNILDISKIEAGELHLEHIQFNIHEVIDDVQKILQSQASKKGINFVVQIDSKVSETLIGDPSRLRQCIINIAGNAIKFTEKGSVSIICEAENIDVVTQNIKIKIIDTGIGMDGSYIQKIYTKFQQEDISSSRKFGGTGLGLVITKEIIEIMEGEIFVESKKLHGTTVALSIPFTKCDESIIVSKHDIIDYSFLKNKSILLVEDNEMNRFVAINALQSLIPNITEAENGKIAIEHLQNKKFDVILMDLQMPVMGGLEAANIIRNTLNIKTPIIALTANAFKSEIEKCIAAGMNNYITKPFEKNDLLNSIIKEITKKNDTIDELNLINLTKKKSDIHFYNLTILREMSQGNEEFVQKMIHLFIELMQKESNELVEAIELRDYNKIKQIAHKIKPSIDNVGATILYNNIRKLENFDLQNENEEFLISLTQEVIGTLAKVIQEITENEL